MTELISSAREWASRIRRDVLALWIAARDPRTPLLAKAIAAAVAAYALSPVDLIPDFVPLIGYLDDLLIVPLGIMLAVRLIPAPLMAEFRSRASRRNDRPASRAGLVVVLAIWMIAAVGLAWLFWPASSGRQTGVSLHTLTSVMKLEHHFGWTACAECRP